MKKLLTIIGILLIILIGIFGHKKNQNKDNVNISEVNDIETYIYKIYMWKDITEEALPRFENINNAPELWVWEVVKKNLEEFELDYNQIQEKAVQLFGNNFNMQFPKEGSKYIIYDETTKKYITTGIGLDMQEDLFLIKEINKNKNKYQVQIVEYLEDYENALYVEDENDEYDIYIKNLEQEKIATIKNTESETKKIEVVKENIDKFTTKTINLVKDSEENLYIESVQ